MVAEAEAAKVRWEQKTTLQKERFKFEQFPEIGVTYLSFDPQHGFQVTYYENEDRSWLWYGGNSVALAAAWKKVEATNSSSQHFDKKLCYKYGPNTVNRATNQQGGDFKCTLSINLLNLTVGSLKGDIFKLSSGRVPYKRERCDAPDEFEIMDEYALVRPATDCRKLHN